jgi:hypothetical protein
MMKVKDTNLTGARLKALANRAERFRAGKNSIRPWYPPDVHKEVRELVGLGVKIAVVGRALKVSRGTVKNWIKLKSSKNVTDVQRAKPTKGCARELTLAPSIIPTMEPLRIRFSNQVVVEIPVGAENVELIRALVLTEGVC